ncbi:OmpA family protein [Edaphobacter flagellatus]|uniref:OmpA family protein n=1 Tax=Edaphobacter flagellatus TaxID=1933044 RepID=UPI0021B368CA|nr:OmpA family protein [Edaphobacter flagellatus]
MRSIYLLFVLLIVAGSTVALAQARPTVDSAFSTPRADLALGYSYIGANAPPGQSGYFGLNGGFASGSYRITHLFTIAGEFTGGHANNISALGQDLTLFTFMGGPRVAFTGRRLVPFAQVLFGGAHATDSYFPSSSAAGYTTSASSWALSAGGGVDYHLTHRLAVRALEAQYMRTALPNGSSDSQNYFSIGAGIVFKFGTYDGIPHVSAASPKPQRNNLSFTCNTNVASIEQGQVLEVTANTLTQPDGLEVQYSWSSDAGTIDGSGQRVTLNTANVAPGNYTITGHASLVTDSGIKSDCQVPFRVLAQQNSLAATDKNTSTQNEEVFHANVQDALFDYDSYEIRPDAKKAIEHAAEYLNAHPAINVLIAGYADERGSAEYNLALGEKRANAARDALIAAGVPAARLSIISYGKEAQVCTANTEKCFQENRRAAFNMHP